MSKSSSSTVPLDRLLEEAGIACHNVQGRLRRMNAFMFAHHLVMASIEPYDRDKATYALLRIAYACGLVERAPIPAKTVQALDGLLDDHVVAVERLAPSLPETLPSIRPS